MVVSEAIAWMEDNMRAKLKYVSSKLATMTVKDVSGVAVVDCGMPSDTFNTAFGGQINEKSSEAVYSFYQEGKQPMAWWIGPSSASGQYKEALEAKGFRHDEVDVGMVCDLSRSLPDYTAPPALSIRECRSPRDFIDFGDVLASIFDPVDPYAPRFYQMMSGLSEADRRAMRLFIGYEGGKPVATSCLFLSNVAGIFDISTRPSKRRLGYGSALFHAALLAAVEEGYEVSVLQASPGGLGIYKRFGFEECCEFNVWTNVK